MMISEKSKFKKIFNFLQKPIIIAPLIFAIGLSLGWYWHKLASHTLPTDIVRIGLKNNKYQFIDPLLGYDIANNTSINEFKPFEKKINDLISQLKASDKVSDVAFYFRGLKSGYWLGVNQDEEFSPGSLMKVPLMMAYLKKAESDPAILSKQFVYDGKFDANQAEVFKASDAIKPGQKYTVDELIKYMIVYSDNNAANVLLGNIEPNFFGEIFADLGIDLPDLSKGDVDFMSPKRYSIFFRILRNATYLNDSFSEKSLELLAQAHFPQGLEGGVPASTAVAHKFGEYLFINRDGSQVGQLHDCGFVYGPGRAYFICIMTKGKNYNDLSEAIKQLSTLTFEQVTNNFK